MLTLAPRLPLPVSQVCSLSFLIPLYILVCVCVIGLLLLPFLCYILVTSESTPSQPQYVFWYHNERMVNYDTERGVQVSFIYIFHFHSSPNPNFVTYQATRKIFLLIPNVVQVSTSSVDGRTESKLTISKAAVGDRGNYTCRFSYLKR